MQLRGAGRNHFRPYDGVSPVTSALAGDPAGTIQGPRQPRLWSQGPGVALRQPEFLPACEAWHRHEESGDPPEISVRPKH